MANQLQDDAERVRAAARAPGNHTSVPWMTKYEFNSVVSLRTMHLSRGAPPLVDVGGDFKVTTNLQLRRVAIRELKEGRLPYIVKRPMPQGAEYWPVKDLSLVAVRHLVDDE